MLASILMRMQSASARLSHRPSSPVTVRVALLAILLAAFGVRLFRLGAESLWYDETFSAYLAKQPLSELIAHTARDIHPPGYYILLHGWQALTGATPAHGLEYLLAWASLFPAVLIVALTIALGRRLGGTKTALIAASLAAIHPPQVWFSQEVRMYAWGACFLLLTLWAVLQIADGISDSGRPPGTAWGMYVVAAVAACYTLYYAVFWLIVANGYILWHSFRHRGRHLRSWLLAQLAVLLAYLPWLPILLRQVVDPPVPPWREPWHGLSDALAAVTEALAALIVGHTPPLGIDWLWAILTGLLLIDVFVYAKSSEQRQTATPVLLLACGPIALLLGFTAVGLPIYHVRYVALFAPALPLLAGLSTTLPRPARRPAIVLVALIFLAALGGLREFWTNPLYAADDHRSAVADLAAQWRPGDAILVNAGWVYTALDVYWPRELTSPQDSLPPDIAGYTRLGKQPDDTTSTPWVIRSGSIDAPADLGWGLPESDFFAISADAAVAALDDLAQRYDRLWHYRLYDTVNDPTGVIRAALQRLDPEPVGRAYPGPGYLLLERYDFAAKNTTSPDTEPLATYADGLTLVEADAPAQSPAGQYLYVKLAWHADNAAAIADDLAVSLRADTRDATDRPERHRHSARLNGKHTDAHAGARDPGGDAARPDIADAPGLSSRRPASPISHRAAGNRRSRVG